MKTLGGAETVLHKSVMSYMITDGGGIVYSNGQYLIYGQGAVKTHLASKLAGYK